MNPLAVILFDLIRLHEGQERDEIRCHPTLVAAAQWKAEDLAVHDIWGHTASNGESPNETVRRFGYNLSGDYSDSGNTCECLAAGMDDPAYALKLLLESENHRRHILGENDFFQDQECAGVGYVRSTKGFIHYWVVLIAHCDD